MNISPDGVTVRFGIIDDDALYYAEKSGSKPNTVQIIDQHDREKLRKQLPQKILIQSQDDMFLRTLTNVHVSDRVLGKYLAVFSWTNEKHHHHTARENDSDIGDHYISADEEPPIDLSQTAILISRSLLADLNWSRGAETLPAFISKLLESYTRPPHRHSAWTFGDDDKNKGEEEHGI